MNEYRESRSDLHTEPVGWYVYILALEDGGYYVGQTNNLPIRYLEHSLGVGAKATAGANARLEWFTYAHSREAARSMELRIQRALDKAPERVDNLIATFRQMIDLVKPDKTLRELEAIDRAYETEMSRMSHWTPVLGGRARESACGWNGIRRFGNGRMIELHGTSDVSEFLRQSALYEAHIKAGGHPSATDFGRLIPCHRCVAVIQERAE